jgi:hypothetical protein
MSCTELIIIEHNFVNHMQTLQTINDINVILIQTIVSLSQP